MTEQKMQLKLAPIVIVFVLWSGLLLVPFVDGFTEWVTYMCVYSAAWIASFVTLYMILTSAKEK